MKIKLHGDDIIWVDIKPNIKIAEFNDECITFDKKYLVLMTNFGQEFMEIYQKYRMNMNIVNMAEMIEKLEELYAKYEYEITRIRRTNG